MTALGLFLRIEMVVETSQEFTEELRVLLQLVLAIAFDQDVDESF